MPNMLNENDTVLYAVYMIKECNFTKNCVMRQIKKNEKTVNKVLWYRKLNGEKLSYKKIIPGMEIEVGIVYVCLKYILLLLVLVAL